MIKKILKSRWFWIGIVILGILTYSAAREWSNISKDRREAQELRQANDKLKADARTQETQFANKTENLSQRTAEMSRQLVLLQKKNEALVQQNIEFVKQRFELEKKYAEIERREKQVTVPAGRSDRVKLFNTLVSH